MYVVVEHIIFPLKYSRTIFPSFLLFLSRHLILRRTIVLNRDWNAVSSLDEYRLNILFYRQMIWKRLSTPPLLRKLWFLEKKNRVLWFSKPCGCLLACQNIYFTILYSDSVYHKVEFNPFRALYLQNSGYNIVTDNFALPIIRSRLRRNVNYE